MYNDIDFANMDFIPGGEGYPDRWQEEGAAYRERMAAIGRAKLNVSYGGADRQKLDLYYPAGKPLGVAMFIHGGYWMRFDRSTWAHFSEGLSEKGWAVALPSYTLAPDARVRDITREVCEALRVAAEIIPGPIRITGHSAGGHLASRLLCKGVLDEAFKCRIEKCVPISPLTDLRDFLTVSLNDTLGLDADEAVAESPVLYDKPEVPVSIWVGQSERPVFLDHARRLSEVWETDLQVEPDRHHFDIIDGLRNADSPLVDDILKPLST